ncbi:MTH1187 family thiamine-binding protein [Halosimplex salinum]|uniref:MTH1187 family thiamine-binding protein n=1 Tax=Halosimplex salinum TaxID=1710538 RepID=UPI000F482BBA|nr:MTH1187 family thiamine-binding protein [Halosimplex salinum]
MTVIGFLSVAPVIEGSMAEAVAKAVAALDEFDVGYETTPMGTIIEADDSAELFAAAGAAHDAVDADRVSTFLKVDDKRTVEQSANEKVEAVEEQLGREAKRERSE